MHDVYQSGKYKKLKGCEKELIKELVELTQLTSCTQDSFNKFSKAVEKSRLFNNMSTFVKEEKEKFERKCKESGNV